MNEERKPPDLKQRTKQYALRIIRLYCDLPTTTLGQTLGKQLLRSGTSVGAQYREACRARSDAEFVSKIESALQEVEETSYWLELIGEAEVMAAERLDGLMRETLELNAIFTASVKTVKARISK
jgi:four helix bundle protein